MFTLKTEYDGEELVGVMLSFDNDQISLEFNPEYGVCESIKKATWEGGRIGFHGCDTAFYLDWRGDVIKMCFGRWQGDGKGGNAITRLKKTPELTASLKQVFDQWKALY